MKREGPRYRIERELGRGAFGVVLLAYDGRLHRQVALKIMAMPDGLSDDEKKHLIDRFYREARAAAGLSHPNVVTIHDISKSKDRHFISMEYLEGITLTEVISKEPLELERALKIADQVLSGLEYAHSRGVIHRDIKPDNIFCMPGDAVKLVDFGLARVQTTTTITKSGMVMGSPGYVSPEIVEGRIADERTDIFSFGVVLYEMLTGKRPFGPETPFESFVKVIYRIMSEDPRPTSEVNPDVPSEFDGILAKCLAKDPCDRYQGVTELRNEISGLAGFDVVSAATGTARSRAASDVEAPGALDDMETIEAESLEKVLRGGTPVVIPTEIEDSETEKGEKKARRIFRRAGWMGLGAVMLAGIVVLVLFLVGVFGGGSGEVECPNLINLSFAQAEGKLEGDGLRVGKKTETFSYEIWKGKVAKQYPQAGTIVPGGSSVDIVVSIGQDVVAVPEVINMEEKEAIRVLEVFGFKVEKREGYKDSVPVGYVFDQRPDPEAVKPSGETVVIMVNNGVRPDGKPPVTPDPREKR